MKSWSRVLEVLEREREREREQDVEPVSCEKFSWLLVDLADTEGGRKAVVDQFLEKAEALPEPAAGEVCVLNMSTISKGAGSGARMRRPS